MQKNPMPQDKPQLFYDIFSGFETVKVGRAHNKWNKTACNTLKFENANDLFSFTEMRTDDEFSRHRTGSTSLDVFASRQISHWKSLDSTSQTESNKKANLYSCYKNHTWGIWDVLVVSPGMCFWPHKPWNCFGFGVRFCHSFGANSQGFCPWNTSSPCSCCCLECNSFSCRFHIVGDLRLISFAQPNASLQQRKTWQKCQNKMKS